MFSVCVRQSMTNASKSAVNRASFSAQSHAPGARHARNRGHKNRLMLACVEVAPSSFSLGVARASLATFGAGRGRLSAFDGDQHLPSAMVEIHAGHVPWRHDAEDLDVESGVVHRTIQRPISLRGTGHPPPCGPPVRLQTHPPDFTMPHADNHTLQ
jgi:hypothetical protein